MSEQTLQPGQTSPFAARSAAQESCLGDLRQGEAVPPAIQAQARSKPKSVRIVREGDMMTMDFLPDRITIVIDARGRVVSSRCG